ncbi:MULTISPECIES: thiamine ABC transporter substrate-binding protein [Streptomyces]|uniref:ABC transporter substrate-binding protein n=1 Tax=Streptomyces qinglanensis TaxID=943816 RepID=A0A1E7K868_9ACTN|nr:MULTISPECIES: thiamine ABC transporter substrate-binding protein [Streptomyces]OEV00118.1 ABC transporter substrate-binding protein [Streptomyces qinglanensis]OEV23730.1 ABC transporter substrate-binding protein [Streptomyces nanshensis]
MKKHARRAAAATTAVLTLAVLATACGGSDDSADSKTVTLVTHDSFAVSKSVLKDFEKRSGYKVEVLRGGDAGAAVNQAVLNKGNPQGDVFFGVDNTLLSRPLDKGVFAPYEAEGLAKVPGRLQADPEKHRVTPVDTGDVCVNYDRRWFADKKLDPPRTLQDLAKPRYKDLLVTEDAANSSPGLAFLLASVAEFGEDGWQDYWKKLRANGAEVAGSWEQAYNDRFSGSREGKGKGDKPLVVSYASSPPAEVMGEKNPPEQAPTGVAKGTCFRQTEYAGLLRGAKNTEGGQALLDFLLSKRFQEDLPLKMFVNPVREDARLPELFTKYGETVDDPATVAPRKIAEHREQWIKTWTSLAVK